MSDEHRHSMKRNDTGPGVRGVILNKSDNKPIDLTGATIRFHMVDPDEPGTPKVDAEANIEGDPLEGAFRYDWSVGDTDVAGMFEAEFEVTLASGAIESYPPDGSIRVLIRTDLA
jgi:hypothetical protein